MREKTQPMAPKCVAVYPGTGIFRRTLFGDWSAKISHRVASAILQAPLSPSTDSLGLAPLWRLLSASVQTLKPFWALVAARLVLAAVHQMGANVHTSRGALGLLTLHRHCWACLWGSSWA